MIDSLFWDELKRTVSQHRLVTAYLMVCGILPLALVTATTRSYLGEIACCSLTPIALAFTYIRDQRDRKRLPDASLAALSGRWVVGGGALALVCGASIKCRLSIVPPLFALTATLLLSLVLPVMIGAAASGLARVPYVARLPEAIRSPASLFTIIPGSLLLATASEPSAAPSHPVFLVALWLASLLFRHTLWRRSEHFLTRCFPHLGTLGFVPVYVGAKLGAKLSHGANTTHLQLLYDQLTVATVAGILIVIALSMRRRPVQPLAPGPGPIHDSLKNIARAYRDVHELGERLVSTIRRSDAGVFGLAGPGGVGKSALAHHVLQKLSAHYFALEVTAPARRDESLGFLVSLCRSVARRVRDDLRASFEPQASGLLMTAANRNATLLLLTASAVVSLGLSSNPALLAHELGSTTDAHPELRDELTIVRQLRTRVDKQLRFPALPPLEASRWRFVIVPLDTAHGDNYDSGFGVIPVVAGADNRQLLQEYMKERHFGDVVATGEYVSSGDLPENAGDTSGAWLTGTTKYFASLIAGLVLPDSSLCRRNVPATHVLRCAAAEAAGLDWKAAYGPGNAHPSPVNTSRLEMDPDRLTHLDVLLGYYEDNLTAASTLIADRAAASDPIPVQSAKTPLRPQLRLGGVQIEMPPVGFNADWAGMFWGSIVLLALVLASSVVLPPLERIARAFVNRRDLTLYQEAAAFLEELSYTSQREATRGVSWQGLSLGSKRTLADRALTLPGLTARYQTFAQKVSECYNGKLVIAIDELDKSYELDQVMGLLSEIKGVLFTEGTYYVLSVPTEAARRFRQPLAPGRDFFEGIFEEILEVPRMNLRASREMIEARVGLGELSTRCLPADTIDVATLLAGGIPREVLRNFRTLSATEYVDSVNACRILVTNEVVEWASRLANCALSGAELIEVRNLADATLLAVRREAFDEAMLALEGCLRILDPRDLRLYSGGSVPIDEKGLAMPRDAQAPDALGADIRDNLHMQLLVAVGRLLQTKAPIEQFAGDVIEAHSALDRQPALAEWLLAKVRRSVDDYQRKSVSNIT